MNRSALAASSTITALGALALVACKDPAANVTHAVTRAPGAPQRAPSTARTEHLTLSPASSRIEFVGAKVTRNHEGRFTQFTGSIDLAPERLEASRVHVDLDMNAFTIEPAQLATHLRSPDFFDVGRFPRATFDSTSITPGGANGATHTVTGNLTLHGQTRAITFPATIAVSPAEVTARAEFAINRRDFGIVYPGMANDLIRDKVVLRLEMHAPRTGT